jgi:SAM-dependent methyltransferase/uncharacterized protein YbaR (Trm112 family)
VSTAVVNDDLDGLLALLACPACGGALRSEDARLACTVCGRDFRLEDRVPVLVASDAPASDARGPLARRLAALLAHPRVYDLQQAYGGGPKIARRVADELRETSARTVLDVGAGTGALATLLPTGARYVWLDNDALKLRGLRSRRIHCLAVLAGADRIPLRDSSADVVVTVDVSHHLGDEALSGFLAEAARVCRERFVFVDAVRTTRARSTLLWKLDLGAHPRPEDRLLRAIETRFTIERAETFRVNHDHLLCVGVPR